MSLTSRLAQLEARQPLSKGKWHSIVVNSSAEADGREAEMRASGELGPDNDLFCIILTSPGNHMTEPLVSVVEADSYDRGMRVEVTGRLQYTD